MKKMIRVFIVLLVYVFMSVSYCYAAEKVRVVEGLIQHVTADSIEVRNKYYNISGVPLKDASGKTLPKSYLSQGKKVEIFIKDNKITTILIHEYMVE